MSHDLTLENKLGQKEMNHKIMDNKRPSIPRDIYILNVVGG
jgi:hypothetical protein